MPEGDTVYRAATRLHAALAGKTLSRSDFRVPKYATADLTGARVAAVRSVGKHLFIDVITARRALSIHTHLKMDGVWHVHPPGTHWRRPGHTARLILATGDVEAVGFALGIVELTADPGAVVAHLGPDLLGADWAPETAAANLAAAPERAIGLALLDQRNLAGIGNIYRSEICFLEGVDPLTPAGAVDLPAVVERAHRLLVANREPPSRRASRLPGERNTTGDHRRGHELWVYDRRQRPCRRCGAPIIREYLGERPGDAERSIYRCPVCQPRPKDSGPGTGSTAP